MSRLFVALGFVFLLLNSAAVFANAPKTAWIVGPINAKAANGQAYCSMKNSFADGNSLVLALDLGGGSSLAVDFRAKGLAAGAQYSVILDVGTISRTLPAIAATDNVLVMQVGNDKPFFDMLRRKEILQVSFKDRTSGFGLSGTAEGLDNLDACLDALRGGKTYTPRIATTTSKTGNISDAEKEEASIASQSLKQSLRDEMERLKAENRRLMLENQQMERRMIAEENLLSSVEKPQKKEPPKKEKERVKAEKPSPSVAKLPKDDPVREMEYPELSINSGASTPLSKAEEKPTAPMPRDAEIVAVEAAPAPAVESIVMPVEKMVEKRKSVDDLLPDALKASGIAAHLSGSVNDYRSYAWNVDGVAGLAQERPMRQGTTISQAVAAYIDEARMKCSTDFAHKLSPVERKGGIESMTGEIACIDDNTNAAAALVFAARGDLFVVSILEGGTEGMERALAKRDALYASIAKGVK